MAIYHLSAKVVSRGKGHSAVAAAAYRSRSSLQDERTGETHDYSRKADELLFEGVYAPKDAPEWARDRAQLWNHVEAFEKRRDAQLAREFEIALPHELTVEQNRYALQDWVRDNFTRKGLIADVVIHAPGQGGDQRNTHAHVLVVTRRLDGSEFAATKERAPDIATRKAELEQLRESWERLGNRHLERHGFAPTLDRRTLREQGSDRLPTVHLGKDATAMERRGAATELGERNRTIKAIQIIDLAAERQRRDRANEDRRLDALRQEEAQRLEAMDKADGVWRDAQRQQQEADARHPAPPRTPFQQATHEITRSLDKAERAADRITDAPLMVMGAAGRVGEKALTRLTDFADNVLGLFAGAPATRQISPAEYLASATARQEFMEQVAEERAREAALDRMAEDRQAGRHLAADDVKRLGRSELENIKRYGDAYMNQLIDDHLRTQERKRGGRERER